MKKIECTTITIVNKSNNQIKLISFMGDKIINKYSKQCWKRRALYKIPMLNQDRLARIIF